MFGRTNVKKKENGKIKLKGKNKYVRENKKNARKVREECQTARKMINITSDGVGGGGSRLLLACKE